MNTLQPTMRLQRRALVPETQLRLYLMRVAFHLSCRPDMEMTTAEVCELLYLPSDAHAAYVLAQANSLQKRTERGIDYWSFIGGTA